jgi:hypothetical protein
MNGIYFAGTGKLARDTEKNKSKIGEVKRATVKRKS